MKEKYKDDYTALENSILKVIKEKDVEITLSKKEYYRKCIRRSFYLSNKYNNVINKVYFSIGALPRLSEPKWKQWLKYLDHFINENLNLDYESNYNTAESDTD